MFKLNLNKLLKLLGKLNQLYEKEKRKVVLNWFMKLVIVLTIPDKSNPQLVESLRVALHEVFTQPLEPIHCHEVEPPAFGKLGLDGDAVPAEQNVPAYPVASASYNVAFVPHNPLVGGIVQREAVQLEFKPQFRPKHCQFIVCPVFGKLGLDGDAVPAEQNVPAGYHVSEYEYIPARVPHEPATGSNISGSVQRVALHEVFTQPLEPIHCHEVEPPVFGKLGLDGDAVPAEQNVPAGYDVSV